MKYRAKCTTIVNWVRDHIANTSHLICRDMFDYYLECDTEREATVVEYANGLQEQLNYLLDQHYDEIVKK